MVGVGTSCSRPAAPALTREAFLTFDNLTGDASLDWVAQAAPRILEHNLTGLPTTVPLAGAAVRDAYLERASRLVHGYFEKRSGKLHFEIEVEDAAEHRMIQRVADNGEPAEADARGVLESMNRVSKALDPAASAFPASAEAMSLWSQGKYEQAAGIDPAFALGWLGWLEQLAATGDAVRASEIADHALAQPGLRSPMDKAQLQLAAATLRKDDAARLTAIRQLVKLVPADAALRNGLAEMEMNARHFTEAAAAYQDLLAIQPENPNARNLLGYAQAFAGDLDAARKSFDQYGRQSPQSAINALDSLGEALFANGKFTDAESSFLEAYKRAPGFLQGESLWKAAHAHWLSGYPAQPDQIAEADKIMDRYFQDRAKARDPLLTWRHANWLYETGRRNQAIELLMHPPPDVTPQAAEIANRQLQAWTTPAPPEPDLNALEQAYQRTSPSSDGLARTQYAEALVNAGKQAEAKNLIKLWPLPEQGPSLLQATMYPKFILLRKTLQP